MTYSPLLVLALFSSGPAVPPPPPSPAPPSASTDEPAPPVEGEPAPPSGGGESAPGEVTYYQFSGLGIDGELRTPALLQFLSRIGGEFETVGIPHRSFMPELAGTVMEDAL